MMIARANVRDKMNTEPSVVEMLLARIDMLEAERAKDNDRTTLYQEYVPVLLGMMLDEAGVNRFEFFVKDMLAFKGKVFIEKDAKQEGHYIVERVGS
jgi:hypothetical protein